uniref:Periplasmic copper-binding protein NosD beta helix domain-containing protein n=1 Tax=Ignisphaera aggregans TaxID=334771 RepID=A0A7C4FIM9_9CREN
MKSTIVALLLILLILLLEGLCIAVLHVKSLGKRFLYVPDDYPSIQLAIDNANPGDFILIREGVYVENIIIERRNGLVIKPLEGNSVVIKAKDEGRPVISIQFSKNITVFGLTITGGKAYRSAAVYILNSSEIQIQKCVLYGNNAGIWITYSQNITVANNNVLENSNGLVVQYSRNVVVIENNIVLNGVGIDFVDASNNMIYHNNFINNKQHVRSHKSVNAWNASYPLGGNYWDNYTAEDLKRGVHQNEPGADSILDTPYKIDDTNIDYYPLAQPLAFQATLSTPIITILTHTITPPTITLTQTTLSDECRASLILLVVLVLLVTYLIIVAQKTRKRVRATKSRKAD